LPWFEKRYDGEEEMVGLNENSSSSRRGNDVLDVTAKREDG